MQELAYIKSKCIGVNQYSISKKIILDYEKSLLMYLQG